MDIKIKLEEGQSLDEAEDLLYKALRGKKKALEQLGERYADPAINDFHDKILADHLELLEIIKEAVEEEVRLNVSRERYL